ncbi:MAG TPA: ABC transporter ATP-binding protein [Methylomirabilota bacterium]|jgi:ABC-2 type transport system ATP-binding protein|nr:ABC transporter ATP-binding protein [Methylomirabilota bacterium]
MPSPTASPAVPERLAVPDAGAEPGPVATAAIEVDGLGIQYSLRLTRKTTIRRSFASLLGRRGGPRRFWALRGLSLTVRPGEVLAVVGPNGAGKTTLLQTLAGIIQPTEGTVTVRGRVAGLLGPGGLDMELSGRENIALFGAFLGVDAEEMRQRADAIVAFADIGEFIDAPVKTYSQGMRARLGFSIASTLEPDILLLDEIVSTGDQEYRSRSKVRLREMIRAARAIVLVTHDMQWVLEFGTRAVIIDRGTLVAEGTPEHAVKLYHERAARIPPPGEWTGGTPWA